jgi:hypothetical protein
VFSVNSVTRSPYAISAKKRNGIYRIPWYRDGYGSHLSLTEPYLHKQEVIDLLFPWDLKGVKRPEYLCLIFHGRRGRGKSTGATAFAKYIYDANKQYNPDYKLYTNYKVEFADMCHPRLVDALITFPEWCHDCMILVDEIAVYFPSVRAVSGGSLNISTFLQEIRKLRVDLIFTTQFPTMIIGNVNIQVDLFVEPFLYNRTYERRVGSYVADSMRMRFVDWWGQWTDRPIRHRWPPEPEDTLVTYNLHNLSPVYGRFDTDEIIPAFWHPSRGEIIRREWKEDWEAEEAAEQAREQEAARMEPESARPPVSADQARSLRQLLDAQPNTRIPLRSLLTQAQRIDPQIKSVGDLMTAMRRLGWTCYQAGSRNGTWMGKRGGEKEDDTWMGQRIPEEEEGE